MAEAIRFPGALALGSDGGGPACMDRGRRLVLGEWGVTLAAGGVGLLAFVGGFRGK